MQILGQASSENAKAVGMLAEAMAETGWKLAREETGSNPGNTGGSKTVHSTKRTYSTSSHAASQGL